MEEETVKQKGWFSGGRGVAAGLVAGALSGALLFAPAISGAKPSGDGQARQHQAAQAGSGQGQAGEQGGFRPDCPLHDLTDGPLAIAAEVIGVDVEDLATAVHDGSTIADVATENGVDVQTVIDAMVADAHEHIAADVEEGKITQEQADEILAGLEEHITGVVNGEFPPGPPPGGPMGGPPPWAQDGGTTGQPTTPGTAATAGAPLSF